MSKRNVEKMNAFGSEASAEEVAKEIYRDSRPAGLETNRVVAKPTRIREIWPDLRQPRRAIPTSVRGYWNGDPDELGDVLRHWQVMAEKESGKKIDVVRVLKGYDALVAEDGDGVIFAQFAKLCGLAASIFNEGLTNPITIIPNGSQWQVETGERRWLAHHLLALHLDEKFSTIPAREVKYDPFRQASENNARDGYNAIEMARQIAILIMEARTGLDGVKYDAFEDMVLAGECDRKFYAQVANGNIHRIPSGMGDKISNATGLSEARISQYRRLLAVTEDEALNDQIWIEADTSGWSERYIREYAQTLTVVKVAESATAIEHEGDESLTAVKHSDAVDGGIIPNNPPSAVQSGVPETKPFTPNRDAFGQVRQQPAASPFGSPSPAIPPAASHVVGNDGEIGAPPMNLKGKKVRLKDGREGTIWEDKGGDKLMFLKAGATISNEVYRSAVAAVLPDVAEDVKDVPPKGNNPPMMNAKLVEDALLRQIFTQARYMAEAMGEMDAAKSLQALTNVTVAEVRQLAQGGSVEPILQGHYDYVSSMLGAFLKKVEAVLVDWAAIDAEERRGE